MRIALAVLIAQSSSSKISISVNKLTDFTAEIEETFAHVFNFVPHCGYRCPVLFNVSGSTKSKISLDVEKEVASITASGSVTFHERVPESMPNTHGRAVAHTFAPGLQVTGTGAFAFSRSEGGGAIKEVWSTNNYHGFQGSAGYCISVHVPPGVLPPGQAFKQMFASHVPQIEAQLDQMPHKDITFKGKEVAEYEFHNEAKILIEHDGTPVLAAFEKQLRNPFLPDSPPMGAPMDVQMEFTSWTQGAGEVNIFDCVQQSIELEAHPAAVLPMLALELLIKSKALNASLASFPLPLPAEPMELLFATADDAKAQSLMTAPSAPQFWPFSAAAAGALGAMIVFGVAKGVRKTPRSEPLLSEA